MQDTNKEIQLKRYKKLFKSLPKEKYSALEEAVSNGLYLSRNKISGRGLENINSQELLDFLNNKLPQSYEDFKKTQEVGEELMNVRGRATLPNPALRNYLPPNTMKRSMGEWLVSSIGGLAIWPLGAFGVINYPTYMALRVTFWGLFGWTFAANIKNYLDVNKIRQGRYNKPVMYRQTRMGTMPALPWYGWSGVIPASFKYKKDKMSVAHMRRKAGRRIPKLEKMQEGLFLELEGNIIDSFWGNPGYDRKWFKKQCGKSEELFKNLEKKKLEKMFGKLEDKLAGFDKKTMREHMGQVLGRAYTQSNKDDEEELKRIKKMTKIAKKIDMPYEKIKEYLKDDIKKVKEIEMIELEK